MKQFLINVFSLIIAIFSFVFLFVYIQTHHIWGNVNIEQILINLETGVDFAPDKLIWGYIISIVLAIVTAYAFSVIVKTNKRLLIVSGILCLFVLWQIGVFSYFLNKKIYSDIYEKEYIHPNHLTYTFPLKKRNIIVAYLESGEENYATDLNENLIKNIYTLSKQNLSFEGFHQIPHQDYTIAAMIQSMCATPYKGSKLKGYEGHQNFLASLVCYPQILQQNSYETVFIKGANINFSRTGLFMKTHGFNKAMGANELNKKFNYPLKDNTGGFEGYHDAALYQMIKEELINLSQKQKPFLLSFITLDTHAPDYFLSPGCQGNSSDKKDIVRCADKMLFDFIIWLQEQPFYKNTTVIVVGDHIETGINCLYPKLQNRKIINFILNPSPLFQKASHTKWTTLDLAPTILNAAGISFEPSKFGLGRSLFSSEQTLYEKLEHKLETELMKSSHVYDSFETVKNKKSPQYHFIEPSNTPISAPNQIKHFATYAKNILGAVFLEELSFSLPPSVSDLMLKISFKATLSYKTSKEIKVFVNGKQITSWSISLTDKQPVLKKVLIPANLIQNDKLLILFTSEDPTSLSDALGIGVTSFSLSQY